VGLTPLLLASSYGQVAIIREIIYYSTSYPEKKCNYKQPDAESSNILHYVSRYSKVAIVTNNIKEAENTNGEDSSEGSPIENNVKILQELLQKQAFSYQEDSQPSIFNAEYSSGNTPVNVAC
jgi:ankyrin repeat protein